MQPFSFLMASVTYTKVKDFIKHVLRILINNYISRTLVVQSEIQLKFSSHPIFSDLFSRHQSDFSLICLNVLPSAIMQGKFDSVLWDMSMFFLICRANGVCTIQGLPNLLTTPLSNEITHVETFCVKYLRFKVTNLSLKLGY